MDSTKNKNTFVGLPLVFYRPQTRFGFGAAGAYSFRFQGQTVDERPSQLKFVLAYTQNKQILCYFPFDLFWNKNVNYLGGEVGYYVYNFPYFGIGVDSKIEDKENYAVRFPRVRLNYSRTIHPILYVGGRIAYDGMVITDFVEDGLLDNDAPVGLPKGGDIFGLGPLFTLDNRDNVFWPTKGWWINTYYQLFSKSFISDFNYTRINLEIKKYHQFTWKHIIALHTRIELTNGTPPFFNLSTLGGGSRLRGYISERFIDHNSYLAQAEYRVPIYKDLSGVVFGGVGTVAPTFNQLWNNKYIHSYGLGIRYMVDREKRVNVRLDYGLTPDGGNFYFTIGEAF